MCANPRGAPMRGPDRMVSRVARPHPFAASSPAPGIAGGACDFPDAGGIHESLRPLPPCSRPHSQCLSPAARRSRPRRSKTSPPRPPPRVPPVRGPAPAAPPRVESAGPPRPAAAAPRAPAAAIRCAIRTTSCPSAACSSSSTASPCRTSTSRSSRRMRSYLAANRNARATLQGHGDERGAREYNIALGQKRADCGQADDDAARRAGNARSRR